MSTNFPLVNFHNDLFSLCLQMRDFSGDGFFTYNWSSDSTFSFTCFRSRKTCKKMTLAIAATSPKQPMSAAGQQQQGAQSSTSSSSPSVAQVIPNRLYFTSYAGSTVPKNDVKNFYVDITSIDELVHYDAFYDDFGPLNLAVLYRFCEWLDALLESQRLNKRIFLYTDMDAQDRVNAVYLIASYMIIYYNLTAEQAYLRLQSVEPPPLIGFRDAAMGTPSYLLHVQHVIQAIEKAVKLKWLNFEDFDPEEYEHFERVENGDLNWIVPGKVLSFCGPHDRSYVENGYPYHSPEIYFDYFRSNNVTTIVRLNKKIYDAKRFAQAGFEHHDLFFVDGSTPSDDIVLRFIEAVDNAKGAVAVHCKAGLGRTGTLIACWMMKHFRLTAPQCMGWLRVCRPGSVIGPQQHFLIEKQDWCWRLGKMSTAAVENGITGDEQPKTTIIKSKDDDGKLASKGSKEESEEKMASQEKGGEDGGTKLLMNGLNGNGATAKPKTRLASTKEAMEIETALNVHGQSQGDRLCEIKARVQQRHYHHPSSSLHHTRGGGELPSLTNRLRTTDVSNKLHHNVNSLSSSSAATNTPPGSAAFILPIGNNEPSKKLLLSSSPLTHRQQQQPAASSPAAATAHCAFSSATTPIKQLKLSSTAGTHINFAALSGHHNSPTSPNQQQERKKKSSAVELLRNVRTTAAVFEQTIVASIKEQQQQNGMKAVVKSAGGGGGGRIPIQKVSVVSSSANNTSGSAVRSQLHRKHFSSSRLLKPYMPTGGGQPLFSERTLAGGAAFNGGGRAAASSSSNNSHNNHNFFGARNSSSSNLAAIILCSPAASSPSSSATTSFGKTLNRHFARINHNAAAATNELMFSSPVDGPLAHNTNCKYELRPRDQLQMPARFATAADAGKQSSTATTTPTLTTTAYGGGGLSRHHKSTRSSASFFSTTRL